MNVEAGCKSNSYPVLTNPRDVPTLYTNQHPYRALDPLLRATGRKDRASHVLTATHWPFCVLVPAVGWH